MKICKQLEYKDIKDYDTSKAKLKEKGYNIIELDGLRISNEYDIFSVFSKKLKFPKYFGNNWAAFYDSITDLMWLSRKDTFVLLKNVDMEKSYFKILLHELLRAKQFWQDDKFDEKVLFDTIIFIGGRSKPLS